MAFDPDAFLAGGAAVADPPAFDPDAFLAAPAPAAAPFDPDAFLASPSTTTPAAPASNSPVASSAESSSGNAGLASASGNEMKVMDPTVPLQGTVVNAPAGYSPTLLTVPANVPAFSAEGDAALRKRETEIGIAPFSLGPDGIQKSIGESLHAAGTTPYVELQKPANTGVGSGIVRGVESMVEGLETPENAAILGGLGAAGKGVQQLASLGFSGAMVKDAVSEFMNAPAGETTGQQAERLTKATLSLLMGGLAGKHGIDGRVSPRVGDGLSERPAGLPEESLSKPVAELPNAGAPPEPTTPNTTDTPAVTSDEVTPDTSAQPEVVPAPSSPETLAEPVGVERATLTGEALPVELLPEQADVSTPILDVKRSPFALGVAPDLKATTWLGKNVKRLFTSTGDLPKEAFEGWIERNGYVKEQSRQTAYAARDLYSALRDEFQISKTEELTKGFEKVPPAFVKQMNQALLGEVDVNALPEKVRAPLQAMRDHIDALSTKMLDEGVIPADLQAKVADNLGVYMTRSYRVFDDPKWAESIPNDVRNRARDFILSGLQKENPAATPANANAVMQSMLQDWKDQGSGALVKSGGKIGSKDLTSFITRKDIPVVLRQLMGEYHDPLVNYARSITKAANLIGSQRFLNRVRAEGEGKFLFKDGEQPATHTALVAAEGSDVMAPLNGLRTTPEIATAFREFGKSDPIKNGFMRALAIFSGVAKTAKTVGSLMTQARNTLGQAYFFAMNGHFDLTKAAPAVKAILADLGMKDTPAGREAYQRYLRLGIVDQSARASELRDTIRDAGLNDPAVNLTDPGKVWAKTARKLTLDAAAKAYQVSDDLGKIIGFENELARQREIHPEWSETTLETNAAERIRNTYPTYSMVPEGVRKLRQLPIAPFVSFAAETWRTAYHNLRYTIEDLRSSNPAQKKAGAQRLAGQLAVVASGYTLAATSRALLGMNAQEEDDANRFMAPWDKDSQIMFTGKENGKATYVNLSYVNPYSYLTDPVISVASGLHDKDQLDDVMLRSFAKLLQPFTSEDILAGSLIDIARNQTSTGRRVFNPGDTPAKQWEDKIAHIYGTLEPGTLTRVKTKIIPAIKGETDRSGRKPELTNEILSELTGFKTQTLDYQQAVGYRAGAFKKADDDADTIFREVAGRRGSVNPDDITDAYKRAARSKFETWQSFYRDVQAARRRGVSDSAIRTAAEARGVSSAETGAVMSGRFVPPRVSPALNKQMQTNGHSLPSDAEMRRAESLVLSGRFE